MIRYKIDILQALAAAGWTQPKLKKYGIMGGGTIDRLREGKPLNFDGLGAVCALLNCQPGDLIENVLTMEEQTVLFNLRHEKREKAD
ncbi:MAG: helix-turn-helix domain-containing protein [Alphaproteobacteria bacterium]